MWHRRVVQTENAIAEANMALVPAMAKRMGIPNVDFAEMVSEGNMTLLRSIEKFDASKGFKFSTYAGRSILRTLGRLARNTNRYRQRFSAELDPKVGYVDPSSIRHECQVRDSVEAVTDILSHNRARLSPIERTVVRERFDIGGQGKGRTLSEVGKMVGLSNERVRQIQARALGRIRAVLEQETHDRVAVQGRRHSFARES
jgi:RNA polymerase sigma factor (sigma-70 family)